MVHHRERIILDDEAEQLKLCYQAAGKADAVEEQNGISLAVVASTSGGIVTAISPTQIVQSPWRKVRLLPLP